MATLRNHYFWGFSLILISVGCSGTGETGKPVVQPAALILSGPAAATQELNATFVFEATRADLASSFECRLDGDGFSSCSSPKLYEKLAEGAHTFEVRVIDVLKNIAPGSAGHAWTIDITPPDTSIASSPAPLTNGKSDRFEFGSNESGVEFLCRLGGAPFDKCQSPRTYVSLPSDPKYTLEVKAVDPAGNMDATPASYEWKVDADIPGLVISSQPAALTANTFAHFEFSCSEASPLECILDGGAPAPCSPANSIDYAGLSAGNHFFEVRSTDSAGNFGNATYGWSIDISAPETSFTATSLPAQKSNKDFANFEFTADDVGSTFGCALDPGATPTFLPCTSGARVPPMPGSLSEGSHTFLVRATNSLGMTDTSPASYSWTVDTIKPGVSRAVISPASSPTTSSSITFTFSSPDSTAALLCRVDAIPFAVCPASPATLSVSGDGSHTLDVKAVDPAGNESIQSHTWIVDTSPPETSFALTPPNNDYDTQPRFTFVSSEPATKFVCRLYLGNGSVPPSETDVPFADCGPAAAGALTVNYDVPSSAGLVSGTYTMEVRAIDLLGIPDSSAAKFSWTINTNQNPEILSVDPAAGATNIELNKVIKIAFTHKMRCSSFGPATFEVAPNRDPPIAGTTNCIGTLSTEATFTPSSNLLHRTTYEIKLNDAKGAILDMNGRQLDTRSFASTFETRDHRFTAPKLISSATPVTSLQVVTGTASSAFAIWSESGKVMTSWYSSGNWNAPAQINQGTAPTESPRITMNTSGSAFAVWKQANHIMGSRYNSSIWSAPMQIDSNTNTLIAVNNPDVSVSAKPNAGRILDVAIVWDQQESAGSVQYHAWYNRYLANDAIPLKTAGQLDTTTTGSARSPSVATWPDGSFSAVWREHVPSSGKTFSVVNNRGCCGLGGITTLNSKASSDTVDGLRISIGTNNTLYVIWTEGGIEAWSNRNAPCSGCGWSSQPRLIRNNISYISPPNFVIFGGGGARSVWLEASSAGQYTIQSKMYDLNSGTWPASAPEDILFSASLTDAPQIAIDSRGIETVVRAAPNPVEARRYVNSMWDPAEVIDSSLPASQPQIAVLNNDNAVVVYTTSSGIYASVGE